MTLFEPSGVAATVKQEAMAYQAAVFYTGSKQVASVPLVDNRYTDQTLYGLAQDRTEGILVDAFESLGGNVRYSTELLSLVLDEDNRGASVSIQHENQTERAHYDFVIGADGIKSTVREQLSLSYDGYDLPETWSIADVDVEDWDTTVFSIFRLSGGRIAVVAPLEPTRVRVISNTEDAVATLPIPMQVVNTRRAGTFNISIRQVSEYSKGPAYLAGDAAHCHSPAGGRGMNLGIADAADLARRIVNNDLEGYSAARHAAGLDTITISERGRKAMTSTNPLMRATITTVMKALSQFGFLRDRAVRNMLDL